MQLIPLTSAGPPPRGSRRWVLAASVLLHLAVLAFLLGIAARRPPPDPAAPTYDLVFEPSGAPAAPSDTAGQLPAQIQAERSMPDDAPPSPPAPSPTSEPAPDGTPSPLPEVLAAPPPAVQPVPSAPSLPEPILTAPPQILAFAPPPPPAESLPPGQIELAPPPAPQAPPATVRLDQPPQPTQAPQRPEIMPVPPPPLPPMPPRPRPPTQQANRLPVPMDLNFGPAAPRPAPAPRGSVASRAIDLALGTPRTSPNRAEMFFDARAKNLGADWEQGLKSYWYRHRYYPEQAAQAGEDGTVIIELTVNRSGHVDSVEIKSRSGSPWLDMAAVGTWRNAQLPPLPAEVAGDHLTLTIPINYLLIR